MGCAWGPAYSVLQPNTRQANCSPHGSSSQCRTSLSQGLLPGTLGSHHHALPAHTCVCTEVYTHTHTHTPSSSPHASLDANLSPLKKPPEASCLSVFAPLIFCPFILFLDFTSITVLLWSLPSFLTSSCQFSPLDEHLVSFLLQHILCSSHKPGKS